MATTFVEYTGDGNATKQFTFPSYQESDVKVRVDGVLKTPSTHYNITSYTTTGGGNVVFTSGNIPSSPAKIRIYRDTNVDAAKATFTAGSSVKAADLNNNTTQLLYRAQEEQVPNLVQTYDIVDDILTTSKIVDGAVTTAKIAADNITSALIADDQINSEHYVDGSIDTQHIGADQITNALIADNQIDSEHYVDGSIDRVHLAADIVDGSKIADNSIDSEHYVDGSIDVEHLADNSVDRASIVNDAVNGDKIADDSINSEHYVDGSIDEQHIANSAVTSNKIADNAVTTTEILNGAVTTAKIADTAVTTAKIADDAITNAKIGPLSVGTAELGGGQVTEAKLAAGSVTTTRIADDAITSAKIAADAVGASELADSSIDTGNLQANSVTEAKIADNAVTAAKIADAVIVTNAEQASHTVNDTTFFTTAAAEARYFNVSSGETIKDGDTFPDNDTTIATTAAINDRIIDIVNDVGGFDIVESEQHFPNTNPQGQAGSAAVLSIKAASTNLVPSGTTLTIVNGNLANNANITITGVTATIPSGFGFIVESTGTLHTYTFHRLVPKATEVTTVAGKATEIGRLGTAAAVEDMSILGTADVVADMNTLGTADVVSDMNALAVSDVISDMNTLAVADVLSDMSTVADNVTNVNNVGNNITNVNSVSNSAGANQTFTVTVQNVSGNKYFIDGVQTPVLKLARGKTYTFDMSDSSNSGHPLAFRDSSNSSYTTGVTTSGSAGSSGATVVIVVAANAPSSLKYYCTSHGNAMGNTITVIDDNVGIVAGSIANVNTTAGSIANVNTTAGSISNVNTVASNISNVNSFFNVYRIGSSNPTSSLDVGDLFFNTTANELKVYNGSSWQSGVTATGNFAVTTGNTFTGSNNHNDNVKSIYGTGSDFEVFHNGSQNIVGNNATQLRLITDQLRFRSATGSETYAQANVNGAFEAHYDNVKKFETTSTGITVSGNGVFTGNVSINDNNFLYLGNSGDLQIYHDGSANYIKGIGNQFLYFSTNNTSRWSIANDGHFRPQGNQAYDIGSTAQQVKRVYSKEFNVLDDGYFKAGTLADLQIYHNGSDSFIKNATGHLRIFGSGTDDKHIYLQPDNGDDGIRILNNGAVKLYHNNVEKFETTSSGVSVGGNITVTGTVDGIDVAALHTTATAKLDNVVEDTTPQLGGNLDCNNKVVTMNDSSGTSNNRIKLGNGGDLNLYHNGTESIIEDSSDLFIIGDPVQLRRPNGDKYVQCIASNATKLFFDGSEKLSTLTDGVLVTGKVAATGDLALTSSDNQKIRLGASNDFEIYHDGTDSYLAAHVTGNIYTRARGGFFVNTNATASGSDHALKCLQNGAVELYYDHSKKFETRSDGAQVTGVLTTSSNIRVSGEIDLGTANGNKFMDVCLGDNYTFFLRSTSGEGVNHETLAKFTRNQGVELFYNASKKFETSNTGISVTGTCTATSFSGDGSNLTGINTDLVSDTSPQLGGNLDANSKTISFGDSSSSSNNRIKFGTTDSDLQIYHDGTNSRVAEGGTGNLMLTTAGSQVHLYNTSNSEDLAKFISNGAVELYNNGTKRFETTSNGVEVSGTYIKFAGSMGSSETFKFQNDTSGGYIQVGFQQNDTDGLHHRAYIRAKKGGSSIAGRLELLARGSGGGTDRGLFIDAANYIESSLTIIPTANNSYNLGSSSKRWSNIYTNDLNLSNEGGSNDVDGSWGNWTIQEGESDLFLKNNRSGKKYKFNLTEVA